MWMPAGGGCSYTKFSLGGGFQECEAALGCGVKYLCQELRTVNLITITTLCPAAYRAPTAGRGAECAALRGPAADYSLDSPISSAATLVLFNSSSSHWLLVLVDSRVQRVWVRLPGSESWH